MEGNSEKDAQAQYGQVDTLAQITALIQGVPTANIHGMQDAAIWHIIV